MEARPQTGRAHRPWTHRLVLMQVACDFTPGRRAMGGSEVGLQAQPRSGCLFVSWRSVLGNATRAANSCQPHPGTRPAPTTQLQAHGGGAGERAGCRPVPVSSALTCTSECDLPTCGSWEVTFPGPHPFSTSTFSTAWCQVKCSEYRFGCDSKPLPPSTTHTREATRRLQGKAHHRGSSVWRSAHGPGPLSLQVPYFLSWLQNSCDTPGYHSNLPGRPQEALKLTLSPRLRTSSLSETPWQKSGHPPPAAS